MDQELFEKYAGLAMHALITNDERLPRKVAELAVEFAKALVVELEQSEKETSNEITLKIYKDSPDEKDYVAARFSGKVTSTGVFKYKDSFWKYRYTSFDKNGEYHLIYQPKE